LEAIGNKWNIFFFFPDMLLAKNAKFFLSALPLPLHWLYHAPLGVGEEKL
jgi:hypothetical protein